MNRERFHQQFDLTNRTAIVTGASKGIGKAIAEGFAALGANVVIASRKADACEAVAESIRAAGGAALACPTHVGDPEQLRALVGATVAAFGGADIIVNNAATPLAQPIGAITPEAFAKSHDVNLRGPVFLVQEALPYLRASQHAAVVNVVTTGIFTHGGYVSLYVSAKAALKAFTQAMASELAGDGIRVNALAPGTVETDMFLNTPTEFQDAAVNSQLIKRAATAEEMVPAAAFLASDASAYMTGQTLVIDGGMTVH